MAINGSEEPFQLATVDPFLRLAMISLRQGQTRYPELREAEVLKRPM
jgi:hypothetical protein